jgi:phage gp36-like protein
MFRRITSMVPVHTIRHCVNIADMAMKTMSSEDPARFRHRHDINIVHMAQLVMRRTSMVQVQTNRQGVHISNMAMETWSSGDPVWSAGKDNPT